MSAVAILCLLLGTELGGFVKFIQLMQVPHHVI